MTVQFNATLNNVLATAISKVDWAAKLQTAFGNSVTLRMFHDTAANAADASVSGVEFLNATITGPFIATAGNITGWGTVTNTAANNAANLLTGTSMLVLEANGYRLTASLGLTRGRQAALGVIDANLQDFDYALFDQPAGKGVGFINGTGIKAPIFLPSGVGPAAPALDADAPAFYQMFSYPTDNTEANRVGLGIKAINVRDPDMAFERDYIAKQIGDVRMMRSADGDGTIFGTGGDCFRFAPRLMVFDKSLNADDSTKPVYRMRFVAKPEGRWASFPYRPDFNIATDTLSPQAFKIEIYRANMTLLDTIEHYPSRVNNVPGSGNPVNYFGQYTDSSFTQSTTLPVEPWWTCQMSLSWQSAQIVPSAHRNHLHPGVEAAALDPTNVKAYDAWPDQWPVITGNYLANGLEAWRVCPKWPRASSQGVDTNILDPVFENIGRDDYRTQMIGYGYYPGAVQQHTWYASPGGSRHDRGTWAHGTVLWLTAPNGIRVHGAVPLSTMQWHWNLGYHNEGTHYVTNPEQGTTISKDHLLYGLDCYNDTYYNGGNEQFRPASNAIRLLTQGNQVHNQPYRDKNGRQFVCEYQRDDQHNISSAAQMLYFNNDPMGALEGRDSFNAAMCASFGMTQGFNKSDFLSRQHAWFFKQLVEIWIIGNNSPNGVTSAEAEFMATRHLGWVVDAVAPAIASPQDWHDYGIRDFGPYCEVYYADAPATTASLGVYDTKSFYFGNTLMLAKQSGWIDRMRAISAKNSQGIDIIVHALCRASVDYFTDGTGASDNAYQQFIPFDTAAPPAKFDWSMFPVNGSQDWLHNPSGVIDDSYPEGYNTQHYRAQFLWVLKYFLTEYNYPRTDAAITKVRAWYDTIEARKNAGGGNWHYRFAMMAIPLPPDQAGAPTV